MVALSVQTDCCCCYQNNERFHLTDVGADSQSSLETREDCNGLGRSFAAWPARWLTRHACGVMNSIRGINNTQLSITIATANKWRPWTAEKTNRWLCWQRLSRRGPFMPLWMWGRCNLLRLNSQFTWKNKHIFAYNDFPHGFLSSGFVSLCRGDWSIDFSPTSSEGRYLNKHIIKARVIVDSCDLLVCCLRFETVDNDGAR